MLDSVYLLHNTVNHTVVGGWNNLVELRNYLKHRKIGKSEFDAGYRVSKVVAGGAEVIDELDWKGIQ
jgi:hypothetical protein